MSHPQIPKRAAQKIVINQSVRAITLPPGQQSQALLFPVKEVEFEGVAMGVLSDGTPYLHLRGLAKLCGVDSGMLSRLMSNWAEDRHKPRGKKIAELLRIHGFTGDSLGLPTMGPSGVTPAYTDPVCMALLEYYAFDANQGSPEVAQKHFRLLARKSLRDYIFEGCGYNPDAHLPESWRNLHERILLNDQVPVGHFSIFREIADLQVHMIKAGCPLDDHTMLDGSVGAVWANYWAKQSLDQKYGPRLKHPHTFPTWYPQAAANPVQAWIYPVMALGEFKTWLYETYVQVSFRTYLGNKVKQDFILPARAEQLIRAVQRPQLPGAPN